MKTSIPSQPLSSGGVLRTPAYFVAHDDSGKPVIRSKRVLVASLEAGYGETRKTDAAFIVTACNAYASDQAKIAALVAALEFADHNLSSLLESRELDSTARPFYAIRDSRNKARAALQQAKGGAS